jgi:HTH-type transcriptional regulator / antitoxin HigA
VTSPPSNPTMKPKILKTEDEYNAALARVESLMDASTGSAEEEELELWSLLVERYEQEKFPIDLPDSVEAIRFRMEQEGLNRRIWSRISAEKNRVSEVLNHKRPLSLAMIRALHRGLGIPAEVLLREPG